MYSPSAALVLQATCPVRAFIEALQTEPNWWKKQIHHAISGFAKDLCTWHHSKITATTTDEDPEPEPAQPVDLPFQCRWCSKTFALHKHVAVHEARRHGALSPARHYAYAPWCLSCMGFYHTVERVQNHLRGNHTCLLRCALVVPPLSLVDLRVVEQQGKTRAAQIKKGTWSAFRSALPSTVALGPALPTYEEAISGLTEDEIFLDRISTLYRPSPGILSWVAGTCNRRMPEGPRVHTADFWLKRPGDVSVSPRI